MNIRNVAARIPRTTSLCHYYVHNIPMGTTAGKGVRSVGGTSMPKPDTPPSKRVNLPIAVAAVSAVAGVTYFVALSSKQYGENLAGEAKKGTEPDLSPNDVARSIRQSMRADAPKSAYKAEEESAPKGLSSEIPQGEMSESIKRSLKTDAPKTAYKAEEKGDSPAGGKATV